MKKIITFLIVVSLIGCKSEPKDIFNYTSGKDTSVSSPIRYVVDIQSIIDSVVELKMDSFYHERRAFLRTQHQLDRDTAMDIFFSMVRGDPRINVAVLDLQDGFSIHYVKPKR